MMSTHTYEQCATNWNLWQEYVDTNATMTREEFDALSIAEKVAMQVEAFGSESTVTIGNWTGPISAARELMDDELCEAIHGTVDSEQEFADDYCTAHRTKYGADFVVG